MVQHSTRIRKGKMDDENEEVEGMAGNDTYNHSSGSSNRNALVI